MLGAHVLLERSLCHEPAAAGALAVPVGSEGGAGEVEGAADEFLLLVLAAEVHEHVPFAGEFAGTRWVLAGDGAARGEVDVFDVDVRFELGGGGAGVAAGSTGRWVGGVDVVLELAVGGKAQGFAVLDISVGDSALAAEIVLFSSTMLSLLVLAETRGLPKAAAANCAAILLNMLAKIRCIVHMCRCNVSLQGLCFSKLLIAWRKTRASELFLFFVTAPMGAHACPCGKSLSTPRPVANPVPRVVMLRFDVVLQVAVPKKSLVASIPVAGKGTLIGMGSLMFGQAHWPSIGLPAAGKIAEKLLRTGSRRFRIGSSSCIFLQRLWTVTNRFCGWLVCENIQL